MTNSTLKTRAKELLERFDPESARKKLLPRPFMLEVCGLPNSGKTTLINDLYDEFKNLGLIATRSVEGADVIPPPRVLPYYNFETAFYAMANAYRMMHDNNTHVGVFDRGPFDFAVRCELFRSGGVISEAESVVFQDFILNRFNRELFDLHIFLMCDVDTALERKFGEGHAERGIYGKTTNPETMKKLVAAHITVFQRQNQKKNLLWLDTSSMSTDEVKGVVLDEVMKAFERRMDNEST